LFQNKSRRLFRDYCLGTQSPYSYQAETKMLPPEGYVPIYVCYLGRHCGRDMQYRQDIQWVCTVLSCAYEYHGLTIRGLELLSKILGVMEQNDKHMPKLNPAGVKYLEGIAQRLRYHYPEVLNKPVYGYSTREYQTTETRNLFLKELFRQNRAGRVPVHMNGRMDSILRSYEQHKEYQQYVREGSYRRIVEEFEERNHPQEAILSRIFHNEFFRSQCLNDAEKKRFVSALFQVYMDQVDNSGEISIGYYFTPAEQYYYWENLNLWQYYQCGPGMPQNGLSQRVAEPLCQEILLKCEEAIKRRNRGADIYFGYDKTLLHIINMLKLPEYQEQTEDPYRVSMVWKNYQIVPMCANLQFAIYGHKLFDDVLVNVRLNENSVELPIEPVFDLFYRWDDVKNYYIKL